MAKRDWMRVSARHPCPICERPTWCTVQRDGTSAHCMRLESAHPCPKGGWFHALDPQRTAIPPPVQPAPSAPPPPADAPALAARMFAHPRAAAKRQQLAADLGLTLGALESLQVGVGWDWDGREFASFPAWDERDQIIGITRRYEGNGKKTLRGTSNSGIFREPLWHQRPGPVYLVEGASDTAVLIAQGLAALGRASNTGSSRELTRLLARYPRPVVIFGENDAKPERRGQHPQCPPACPGCAWCWPGLYGAQSLARQLRRHLPLTALPPVPYKDIRDWQRNASATFFLELFALTWRAWRMDGKELLESLQQLQQDVAALQENQKLILDRLNRASQWAKDHERHTRRTPAPDHNKNTAASP